MNIRILTVSRRQPDWINEGYQTYARRLQAVMPLELVEISPVDRRGHESPRQLEECRQQEGLKIRGQCRPGDWTVALDERGRSFTTEALAGLIATLRDEARSPVFIIGGADGLHPDVIRDAGTRLSLSALTLPHGLVRVILAEALYRAFSLLNNHPYHRA